MADSICYVSKERIFDLNSDPDESLMDELKCPIGDELLIALRKAFSLTFPRNPFITGLREALAEIRRVGVDSLKPMPEVLLDLELPPIPPVMNDPVLTKTRIFQFLLARRKDLDIAVKVNGKRRRLLDLAEHEDATALITTLRSVVTDTFEEAHSEDQHSAILKRIRRKIHDVLPPFNACLESIEVEPIAEHCSEVVEEASDDEVVASDQSQ